MVTSVKSSYTLLNKPCLLELQEKKSRFIAQLSPAQNRDEAMNALEIAQHTYPDARHHCWGYLIGDPHQPTTAAFSDDGEPGGTAGKPILNVLTQRGIGDTVAVVSRYFGGIKLGAGGLVRAYGQAVSKALDIADLTQKVPMAQLAIQVDYPLEDLCRRTLMQHGAEDISTQYHQEVLLQCSVPELYFQQALTDLQERCGGAIKILDRPQN